MQVGDYVVRQSYGKDITFRIIDIVIDEDGNEVYELKGVNIRIEADASKDDLEVVATGEEGENDRVFNEKINGSIKKIIKQRTDEGKNNSMYREIAQRKKKLSKDKKKSESENSVLAFGRPGRVLHIDADAHYLEVCLKTYKEFNIEAVGRCISEQDQPKKVLELVKEIKPDIVVITGHDSIAKGVEDYTDIENYRNSQYYIEAVAILRNYEPNYDDLVIFAGACQSYYEGILDAGANFASSPNRVLIHCLDPVLICEKIAYTNIQEVVDIHETLENTITGVKGVGGLQTRGKYREGFPKSLYLK